MSEEILFYSTPFLNANPFVVSLAFFFCCWSTSDVDCIYLKTLIFDYALSSSCQAMLSPEIFLVIASPSLPL